MLPPSSVTRNASKQKRSASCAELWIIGRSDTTTLRASHYRLFGKRGARHGESVRRRTWSKELVAGNRPDYRTTDHWTTGAQSAERVKASLTRLREDDRDRRSESGMTAKRRVIGYCCRNGKYHRIVSHRGLNFSMIERGRFGSTDEGQP